MSDEMAFLQQICDHPDDLTTRLVYADYLDDHPDGETVPCRNGCALYHGRPGFDATLCGLCHGRLVVPTDRRAYAAHIRHAVGRNASVYLRPTSNYPCLFDRLPPGWTGVDFVHGFAVELEMSLRVFMDVGPEAFVRHPIRSVRLTTCRPVESYFAQDYTTSGWHQLRGWPPTWGDADDDPEDLPPDLFDLLEGGRGLRHWRRFSSSISAQHALSDACVRWARSIADKLREGL